MTAGDIVLSHFSPHNGGGGVKNQGKMTQKLIQGETDSTGWIRLSLVVSLVTSQNSIYLIGWKTDFLSLTTGITFLFNLASD